MCGITDPGGCIEDAARSTLEAMSEAVADATAWIITESFTWWVDTDAGRLNGGLVNAVKDATMPLTVSVAAAGMIVLGIKMVLSGSPDPLLTLGEGTAKLVFWTVAGTVVLGALVKAAAAFSGWLLESGSGRDLGERLVAAMGEESDVGAGLVLLLALLGFLAGVMQWMISCFREGAIVILGGCLPLAASGALGVGRQWLGRVTGWCLALVFWQPAAALVYSASFAMMESARGAQEMLVGIGMLFTTIVALPALIKLFTWVVNERAAGGGGGGGSRAAGAALALQMRQAVRGGARMSPAQHAQMIGAALPGQDAAAAGAGPATAPGAAPGARTAPADGGGGYDGRDGAPSGAAATPPGTTPAFPPAAGPATQTAAAGGPGAAAPSPATAGAPGAAGAAGGGGAATGGADGARAAAVAGPLTAAAAAAAAGGKAAGRAMTDDADTTIPTPPTPRSGT
ncbi:hypothetical protein ACXZ65_13835 [Streptomyces aculeolatus]